MITFLQILMALGFLYLSLAISFDSHIKNVNLKKEIDRLKSWRVRKSRHDFTELKILSEAMLQLGKRIEDTRANSISIQKQFDRFIQEVWNKKMPKLDREIFDLKNVDRTLSQKNFELATKSFEDFVNATTADTKLSTRIDHLATKVNKLLDKQIIMAGEVDIDNFKELVNAKNGSIIRGREMPKGFPKRIKKQNTFNFKGKHRGWKGIWKISEQDKKEIETAKGTYVEIGLRYNISRSRVGQIKQDYKLRNNDGKKLS